MTATRKLALGTILALLVGCNDGYGVLLAKKVENGGDLVGGPAAVAGVGDFLLENDRVRINILGVHDSQGPGVFGGSVVDVDLRRDRLSDEGRMGHDRFAEMFPVSNLLVPAPVAGDVTILHDGSDGAEATIRVEADGGFLFEALSLLQSDRPVLAVLFPDIKPYIRFRTDYTLRPGSRSLEMRTLVTPSTFGETPVPLDPYTGPVSVFGQIFGDDVTQTNPPPVHRAGVVGGDFVFFGGQNTLFAPGIGFDTDKAVHDAFNAEKNTFEIPLTYDFVAAVGADVSYAYYTLPAADGSATVVDVPLFTSSATAFLTGGKNCLFAKSDDATCDKKEVFSYERRLAVGEGDVGSVLDEILRARGTPTGTVKGYVRQATGEPSLHAHLFVFADPAPGTSWASVDTLAEANTTRSGSVGLVDAIDADRGLDPVLDGDFNATLPEGYYVAVARSADGMGFSTPQAFHLAVGHTVNLAPIVATPGTLEYRVTDELGQGVPAKLALVGKGPDGALLEGDGLRRVYLGDARLGNGVRAIVQATPGSGAFRLEPGEYRVRASRGPEYGIFEQDVFIASAGVARVDAIVRRELDTSGWMSADMHLHDMTSFDSGMRLDDRVMSVVTEGVEFAVSTDHDVETDYAPTVKSLLLDPWISTAVGVETTTIEQGHFIGFPLSFDATVIPTHGAPDPTCETGGEILDDLRSRGDSGRPFTIVAHPRDGFFGYIEQLGVDGYTLNRSLSTLEDGNAVLQTASCDFDGLEVINGKRFDLVRTATVGEVVDYNRCRARVDAVKDASALEGICPEYTDGMLAACAAGEPILPCRDRNRSALAFAAIKRILTRTPEEQAAIWGFSKTAAEGEPLCNVAKYGQDPVPAGRANQPCTVYSGQVDDFFRYLEHGLVRTPISSSDSHEGVHEPGYPRTFFRSPTDSPLALATGDVVASLRSGSAFTSYGPFVRASIEGKTFGEVARAHPGEEISLTLQVSTASWFGVDRIEIYENGLLVKVIEPKSATEDLIDYEGSISLDVPPRDSWVVIIAMGLEDRNLMRQVALDVPFGEIQIARVTSDAFQTIPQIAAAFPASPILPDWFPIPAYAVTNAIFLDTDGNGAYDAPLPSPAFCSRVCDPSSGAASCPAGQSCIEAYGQCGANTGSTCDHRVPWTE